MEIMCGVWENARMRQAELPRQREEEKKCENRVLLLAKYHRKIYCDSENKLSFMKCVRMGNRYALSHCQVLYGVEIELNDKANGKSHRKCVPSRERIQ